MLKLSDLESTGKKVLVRCDFNVPLKDGIIQDDTRIVGALPTIKKLLDNRAAVILISHLGRPKGQVVPEMSLKPVADRLNELLEAEVKFCEEAIGDKATKMALELAAGEVLVLENLRFYAEEKNNDRKFAESLASLADLFVQDAFGTIHRKHASMCGVPEILVSAAGLLLEKEITFLGKALVPEKPMALILGGAKLETKIPIIENMLDKADILMIGGGMAFTLLKAKGSNIGKSLFDEDNFTRAVAIFQKAEDNNVTLFIPEDHVCASGLEDSEPVVINDNSIPDDLMGLDIGEKTSNLYKEKILHAKTIVINGPMGVFENPAFSAGTRSVLEAIRESTENGAVSIVGGGDTVSAITNLGFDKASFTHVSTGGGASLKFLEGSELPGLKVLEK
ncbi:phosphoglycerate kinase [Elusimicrobiota bacterium]